MSCQQVLPTPGSFLSRHVHHSRYHLIDNVFKFILTMAILFFFVTKGKTQCVLDGDWQSIDATCPTSSDGAICCDTLYGVVPGTGLPPYAYSISPAVGNYNATTNCFENLPVGTYTVTTTSSDGCIGVFTNLVVMSTYAEISATFNITPASCGASDGSICATVTGGSGSFSYNWTGPPAYNTTLSTTNCLSGVPAGIYQLFIDDLNSICSRQYSRTISEAALTVTATATAATCQLWPNPCHNVLKGIIPTDAVAVRFIDQTGRVVIEEKVFYPNQQWDVSGLECGVYVVEVELADKRRTSAKLIRQ